MMADRISPEEAWMMEGRREEGRIGFGLWRERILVNNFFIFPSASECKVTSVISWKGRRREGLMEEWEEWRRTIGVEGGKERGSEEEEELLLDCFINN